MIEPKAAARIDVLHRCDALAKREDRFVDERHQHAVDDEARRVVGVDDLLAEPAAIGLDPGERIVARREAADQFDQPHHRHRVEEMDTDEARRIGRRLGEPRDRDRTGVAREDRGCREMFADAGENRALDFLALGRRFDDEVGGGEGAMVGNGRDAFEQRIGVALAHLLFRDQAAECLGDAGLARFGAGDVDVGEEHVVAGARRHLRDPRAHLPRSDNADDHILPFR